MFVLKFTLLAFLMMLAIMVTLREQRAALVGGPFYYADPERHPNPIQPKFRLSPRQAFRSKRHCEAYFDERSLPLLVKHMEGKAERWRMTYIWDRQARLKRRIRSKQGRIIRVEAVTWPDPQ